MYLDISVEHLAAQCFAFFLAGYSSQSILGSALMELARNPEVQNKLRAEIDDYVQKENGNITYDTLNEMKYLEKVIFGKVKILRISCSYYS